MRILLSLLLLTAAFGLLAGPAHAQNAILLADYVGYGWETGGFLPSNPGDELDLVGVADNVASILGVDLGTTEVTFYIYGLVSTGEFVSGGVTYIAYVGGTLELWADGAQNSDYGTFPPNGTSPSTFMDGTLLFQGNFTNFQIAITGTGIGGYEGDLDAVAGTVVQEVCANCAYTWGGAWTQGVQLVDGYDLQIDGSLQVDPVVSTEDRAWGSLKSRYDD